MRDLSSRLKLFCESKVDVPRIMHGESQSVETLINEEALFLAKYLGGENDSWIPRIPSFPFARALLKYMLKAWESYWNEAPNAYQIGFLGFCDKKLATTPNRLV
jgi:hypothetical protein